MDYSQLASSGRFSSGNQQSLLPPPTPPYKKGEADPRLIEPKEAYFKHIKLYIESRKLQVAINLQSALERRANGEFCVTMREADTAARSHMPLDRDFVQQCLMASGSFILDSQTVGPKSVYGLRSAYNRGVNFKKLYWESSSQAKRDKADTAMKEILTQLRELQVPAWPEEIVDGFATELCKPEYMTFEQYENAARSPTVVFDPNAAEDSFQLPEQAST